MTQAGITNEVSATGQIEPPLLPAFVLFFGFGLEPDKADLEEGAPAIAKLDPYMDARSCVEQ